MIRLRKTISRTLTLLIAGMTASVGGAETSPIRPGDRIALVGNTFADQLRMHGYLETLLLQRSAGRPVSIRNLGWAGDMLTARDRPTNFPTEESTLRAHKADVIVACFGMGESFTGETGLAAFRNDLESFIASHKGKKYNGKSEVRLILISPITYEDLGSRTPNHERRNLELAAYVQTMNETSAKAGLPFINLYAPTSALMADSVAPKLTGNGVNLNAYGYWCVSRTMADRLLPGPAPWNLTVDAGSGKAEARGVAITGVKSTEHNLAFTVREETWPSLSAPVEGQIHRDLDSMRDTLSVKNLPAGAYRLDIDDQPQCHADASRIGNLPRCHQRKKSTVCLQLESIEPGAHRRRAAQIRQRTRAAGGSHGVQETGGSNGQVSRGRHQTQDSRMASRSSEKVKFWQP